MPNAHPLMTIRFEHLTDGTSAIRYWYHVPRAGDYVGFTENVRDRDHKPLAFPGILAGTVTLVMWGDRSDDDEVDVVVRVK